MTQFSLLGCDQLNLTYSTYLVLGRRFPTVTVDSVIGMKSEGLDLCGQIDPSVLQVSQISISYPISACILFEELWRNDIFRVVSPASHSNVGTE